MMDMKSLGKKKAIDPEKKDAKLKVLKEMRGVASEMMGDGLKDHMAKATVIAKDPSELKAGLQQAQSLIPSGGEMKGHPALADMEEAAGEDLDDDMEQDEPMAHKLKVLAGSDGNSMHMNDQKDAMDMALDEITSPDEIEEAMQKLMAKKQELSRA